MINRKVIKSDFKTSLHFSRSQFRILMKIKLNGPNYTKYLSENERKELGALNQLGFIAIQTNSRIRLDASVDACLSQYFSGLYELMKITVHKVSEKSIRYSQDKTLELMAKHSGRKDLDRTQL